MILAFFRSTWYIWVFLAVTLWANHLWNNLKEGYRAEGRAEVQAQWDAENDQEDKDAKTSREGWQAMVDARDADIAAFKTSLAAESLAKQKAQEKARIVAEKLKEELANDILANPMDAVCSLSDNALRLRNEAICAANAGIGRPCVAVGEASGGGLPGTGQSETGSIAFGVEWAPGRYTDG